MVVSCARDKGSRGDSLGLTWGTLRMDRCMLEGRAAGDGSMHLFIFGSSFGLLDISLVIPRGNPRDPPLGAPRGVPQAEPRDAP